MRTTLNVDDDVLLAARQRAALDGVSVGEALSELARQGLAQGRSRRSRNGVPLIPKAKNRVTVSMVQELTDESV